MCLTVFNVLNYREGLKKDVYRCVPLFLKSSWLTNQLAEGWKPTKTTQHAPMLRSKGLKDATCVGWFGDDWDCSVGFPPEAMDHVSNTVLIGYAV